MDINDTSKRADDILRAAEFLPRDSYYRSIVDAASTLVSMGNGQMQYTTQWSSGTTLWMCDCGNCSLTIDANGEIK